MPKLLVVDDNSNNRLVLSDGLADADYKVIEASSGVEALIHSRREKIDCILLDIAMPGMDGLEVCHRLKADPQTESIPVIVVSAMDATDDIIAGLDAGADDYISKPFNLQIVKARIRSVLHTKATGNSPTRVKRVLERASQQLHERNRQFVSSYQRAFEFVDQVAHDLRTPLSVIKSFSEILDEELVGPVNQKQQKYLQLITSQADELALMVSDMLDISCLQAGTLRICREYCRPQEIVDRAFKTLQPIARTRAVNLTKRVPNNLPKVLVDREKICRVIINLAINGIFSTASSSILNGLCQRRELQSATDPVAEVVVGAHAE